MASSKPLYMVQVADRQTGELTNLRIRAVDQDAATAAAMEQGWLVESTRLIPEADENGKVSPQNDRARWVRRVSAEPLGLRMLGMGQILVAAAIGLTSKDETERAFAFGLWITGAIFVAAGSAARYIIFAVVGPDARK
jgi:hypothetical protein